MVGVSADSLDSHEKFKSKMSFPFELLADDEQKACQLFDVIEGKEHVRQEVHGHRAQHLPDRRQGVLRQEWRKVKVPGHVAAVLDAVRDL